MYVYVYYVHSISCMCIWLADCWLWYMCLCVWYHGWYVRHDQLAVGTQNCFSTLCYTPYTNIKTSAKNAPKCTTARQKKIKKNLGRGHSPLPRPLASRGRGYPSTDPTPSAPSALGVSVPFHLRLEDWAWVVLHIFSELGGTLPISRMS